MSVTAHVTAGEACSGQLPAAASGFAWHRLAQDLLNHPNRGKIVAGAVAAIVLLVAFAIHQASVNKSLPPTAATRGRAGELDDAFDDDELPDVFVNLAIPSELDLSGGLRVPPEYLLKDDKGGKAVKDGRPEQVSESKRPPRAPRPRLAATAPGAAMPEWLQPMSRGLVIPEHLSLRSESAVDPDALEHLKWSDLAPDQQQWFRGRARLELEILVRALDLLAQTPVVLGRSQVGRDAAFLIYIETMKLRKLHRLLAQASLPEETPGLVQRGLRRAALLFVQLGYSAPDLSEGLQAR
jgi:hypothetical protein